MCICKMFDRVCKNTKKQMGLTNQKRLKAKAAALKLFILQEQKHKNLLQNSSENV